MEAYPSSLYTHARNYLNQDETLLLACPELEDCETFERWVQDLGEELEAAVGDRIIEWSDARTAGLALGHIGGMRWQAR